MLLTCGSAGNVRMSTRLFRSSPRSKRLPLRSQPGRSLALPQPDVTPRRAPPSLPAVDLIARHAGGRARFMKLAALAARIDPRIQRVVTLWSRLNAAQRSQITLDQVAEVSGIPSKDFVGTVV